MPTLTPTLDVTFGDVIAVHQSGCNPDHCDCQPWSLTVVEIDTTILPTLVAFRDRYGRECVALKHGAVELFLKDKEQ